MSNLLRWPVAGLCAAGLIGMQGCAYVDPYVRIQDDSQAPAISPRLPQVAKSVAYLDARAKDAEGKRDSIGQTHRVLDLLTFGFASGAVAAPIFSAHRDATAALTIAAGLGYAMNSLFFTGDRSSLYNAALTSLICLKGKAMVLNGAVSQAFGSDGADRLSELHRKATSCTNATSGAQITAAFEMTRDSADRAVGSDAMTAAKLQQAGMSVLATLNDELDKRSPRPEAILAAAKSVAMGVAPAGAATSKKADAGARFERYSMGTCSSEEEALAEAYKPQVIAEFQRVNTDLKKALDAIESLESACAPGIAPIPDLVVSQEAVTLAADVEIHIRVSGGRPPYQTDWDTDPQSNGITMSRAAPDVIVLRAGAKIGADKSYKLSVIDSSASSRSKVIAVTAKKTPSS